jgi:hypothetical protein
MRGNAHVRFGGRAGETDRPRGRHRAPARPYLANRCLDQVRRRVQNQTLGHRGRKRDPLYYAACPVMPSEAPKPLRAAMFRFDRGGIIGRRRGRSPLGLDEGSPDARSVSVRVTGPLMPYAEGFRAQLADQGYAPFSACAQLRLAGHLSRWLALRG